MKGGKSLFSLKRHANGQRRPRKSDSLKETSYQASPPTPYALHTMQPELEVPFKSKTLYLT